MDWFKAWHVGILRGSLANADDSTQLIWIKLLAMASDTKARNGRLEFAKGKPMSRNYLIACLNTTPEKFDYAIEQFKNDLDSTNKPRLTIEDDGTIVLNNWLDYQHDTRKPYKKPPMDVKQKRAMQRSINNQFPQNAIDDLKQGFGYDTVDKNGEVLSKDE